MTPNQPTQPGAVATPPAKPQLIAVEADPDFPDDIDPADRAFWADKETIPVEPGQATLI